MHDSRYRGRAYIRALKRSLVPHTVWAVREYAGPRPDLEWREQIAKPGYVSAHFDWCGGDGTAASIAAILRQIPDIWFEIWDRGGDGALPGWIMYTPSLGVFYTPTDHAGNFLVSEDRVRVAYERSLGDYRKLFEQFSLALGEAWKEELDPLRSHESGARVIPFKRLS